MRRFLVLALTVALGLTALVAVPATATEQTDEDCTWVETWQGKKCLTDDELQRYKDRDRDHDRDGKWRDRDKDDDRDRDWRDKDGDRKRWGDRHDKDWGDRHDKDWRDKDWRDKDRDRDRDRKDRLRDRGRVFDAWLWRYLWDDPRSNDNCGCLSKWETKRLERTASNAGVRDARRILWYLHDQDCMNDREYKRLRRDARFLDEDELMDIIGDATECKCTSNGRYWMDDRDLRRLDRRSNLNERRIRNLLGFRGDRDCITRKDVRRVDRWDDDLDYWDFLDILDWGRRG